MPVNIGRRRIEVRFVTCLPALAACFAAFAAGQSPPTASQLEAFERFAQTSGARVVWSREVGHIDTDRARAAVTALTIEVMENGTRRMRGVRIDLTERDRRHQVYISVEYLKRAIDGLGEITRWKTEPPSETTAPKVCLGSELFWMQQDHGFAASHCTSADWVGLVVHHNQHAFNFTDREAEDFAEVLVAARDELTTNRARP